MLSFDVAFSNVAVALMYLLPGFIIQKCGKLKSEHLSSMSALLIYGFTPCMMLDALLKMGRENANPGLMALFFVLSFAAQGLFMLLLSLLFRKKKDDRYRMLTIASVMGNTGFFGLPIVRALLPEHPEAAAYSMVFVAGMNIFAFTVGVFSLTREKKYMSVKKGILNPAVISFVIGLILYWARADEWLPGTVQSAIGTVSSMTTPFCMMILGARLATMPLKEIFLQPFNYLIAAGKLLLFPLFSYALVVFLPVDPVFKASMLLLSATPCASIILNLAEMHGSSQKQMAADCILLSTLMCVITIPLLTLMV